MSKFMKECVESYKELEDLSDKTTDVFNKNTSLYDGDPLFKQETSPACKYWVPRDENEEEDFFMNYNCGHPDAECDFGDTDHCSIGTCPDEDKGSQIGGQLAQIFSKVLDLELQTLDIFQESCSSCDNFMIRGDEEFCKKIMSGCCMADCPFGKE